MKMLCLVCCVLLVGCAGIITQDGISLDKLDYGKLFQIAYGIVVKDADSNLEALDSFDRLTGGELGQKVTSWYKGTMLAVDAAKALVDGIKSRDVRVTEIINQYQKGNSL